MGLFSFGGSKQSSSSSGFSSSSDRSESDSVSGGQALGGSQSTQAIAFEDVFARLFGGAEGAAGGLDTSLLTGAANQLFSGGVDFLDSLSGGPGTDFLQARVSGESPVLGEQIGALGDDIGKFFQEQILPGITSEAVAGGTLGGGRQGVAEGVAGGEAARQFSQGATALRAADITARDAAATTLGSQRIAGATAGLSQLSSLAGIADFGFSADLAPFERLAGILGGPTVLGESSSFSTAEDFARAFSSSFGSSRSTTSSQSKGKAVDIGF
jgi:hypothetical protein